MLRALALILLLSFTHIITYSVKADTIWTSNYEKSAVEVEVIRPDFSSEWNGDVTCTAGFITFRPGTSRGNFICVIPYASAKLKYERYYGFTDKVSESAVGNIYLGIQDKRNNVFRPEFGIGLPILTGTPLLNLLSPYIDLYRMDAFSGKNLTFAVIGNLVFGDTASFSLRFRAGYKNVRNLDNEVLAGDGYNLIPYSIQLRYENRRLLAGAGFSGVRNQTASDAETQAGLSLAVKGRFVAFGLSYRLPITKSLDKGLNSTLGLIFQFNLPNKTGS